ncbi:MAG: hypothetical protein FWF97_04810 [Alphaproteobacteria bacterium]|nr:hypothetical protein [Alphaproteobacteria bacterium]
MKIKNIMMLGVFTAAFAISGAVADVAVAPRVTANIGGGATMKVKAGESCSTPGGIASCLPDVCACVTQADGTHIWWALKI